MKMISMNIENYTISYKDLKKLKIDEMEDAIIYYINILYYIINKKTLFFYYNFIFRFISKYTHLCNSLAIFFQIYR